MEECGPCPVFVSFTLAFAIQLRKKHGKPLNQGKKNLSQSTVYMLPKHPHTHTHTHIHTHTHTLQNNIKPTRVQINPLNPELNPICYLLALLGAHHFLHVSRIRVKLLTFRLLMLYIYIYIYIYGAPIFDVSRSHTTTQHSR